jgi:uncharacterized protein involved in exopolysaccharide biosynthesis
MDERLDVRKLAEHVWSYRKGLALLCVAAALAALGLRALGQDSYRASAQVLVLSPVASTELRPQYELSLLSYVELARGAELQRRALEALGTSLDPASRAPGSVQVDVSPVRDTRVLVLSARAPVAQDAALVANELARQFVALCERVRSNEILDKRRLLHLELQSLEKQLAEEERQLGELLAAADHWTEAELRSELARLRRLQFAPEAPERLSAEGGAEPRASSASAAGVAPQALEKRLAELTAFLRDRRELLDAISLQAWKREQLREAYASLVQQAQRLGPEINERLGHALLSSEAGIPARPASPPALQYAALGGVVMFLLSVSLLVFWALLTGEHLGVRPGPPAA